jgi:hypothetical protein
MLVKDEIMRLLLEKKTTKKYMLFLSTSIVVVENSNGEIHDGVAHTKILC